MAPSKSWDGIDRRGDQEVVNYKVDRMLVDMKETKEDVEKIKEDMTAIKVLMAEMRMELKQIVGKSSAITSAVVSVVITAFGGILGYYLTK